MKWLERRRKIRLAQVNAEIELICSWCDRAKEIPSWHQRRIITLTNEKYKLMALLEKEKPNEQG